MTPSDSQSGPIVRHATPADLPGIGHLGALLVEEHHGFDPRRFLAAGRGTAEGYASFMSTQLEDPDAAVLVADDKGEVIGYVYAAVEGYDYMALRGPSPLTADPHVSTGSTPGVGVIKVRGGGRDGTFEAVAPVSNVDGGGVERADVHALTIRLK